MTKDYTDVTKFFDDIGDGVFKKKLAHLISKASLGTYMHGDKKKRGRVTIELTFDQFGYENVIVVSHKLSHSTPTKRGKQEEVDTTETFMYSGAGGALSVDQPLEEPNGQTVFQDDTLTLRAVGDE